MSFPPGMSLTDLRPETSMGTTWSSSPWMIKVGTSNFLRSSVRFVSENALTHSYRFLKPPIMPCFCLPLSANNRRAAALDGSLAVDHPVAFEFAKLFREYTLSCQGHQVMQFAEPQGGLTDVVENRHLVFPTDDFERCVDG
jgi:hypothetical protein